MDTDLHIKAEKYGEKAAKCRRAALGASDGPQRTMYEVLADYYDGLATDFRQALEKRTVA